MEVTAKQDCGSCGTPTTGASKITGKPLCSHCQARPVREPTLATMARERKPSKTPKGRQCTVCLEPETFGAGGGSLKNGRCRDRAACEQRQPALIPAEDTR